MAVVIFLLVLLFLPYIIYAVILYGGDMLKMCAALIGTAIFGFVVLTLPGPEGALFAGLVGLIIFAILLRRSEATK